MGWLFTRGQTKAELVKKLTTNEENANGKWEYTAHSLKGNCLWKILRHTDSAGNVVTLIALDMLSYQKGYGHGYKSMDETMGPCYYNVPVTWFKKVPCPASDTAREWRETVLARQQGKKLQKARYDSAEIGQIYKLVKSSIPSVLIQFKRGKQLIGVYNGRAYRIPVSMLGEMINS